MIGVILEMESGNLKEGSRSFAKQDQELPKVDLAIAVEICLIDHLLDIHLGERNGIGVHQMLDIILIEFAISINIQLLELFPQKFLVFDDVGIEETGNELRVIHLTAVIEVHSVEDLLNVAGVEIGIDLLAKVL